MTCVVITKADYTTSSFSCCTIDQFTVGGTIEVTTEAGYVMRAFGPGEWRHATVYDDREYPLYWWDAKEHAKNNDGDAPKAKVGVL